jgi:hypothetical protein
MKQVFYLVALLLSLNAVSSELTRFDNMLKQLEMEGPHKEMHQKTYHHVLSLGSFSREYLKSTAYRNGLFIHLIKNSWLMYIEQSHQMLVSLEKALNNKANAAESLQALILIKRTQQLYNVYFSNRQLRYILLEQSVTADMGIEDFINTTLSSKVHRALPSIIQQAQPLTRVQKHGGVTFEHNELPQNIAELALTQHYLFDHFRHAFSVVLSGISYSLGEVISAIEWGDGGKLKNEHDVKIKIHRNLQPLDIIFEKKTFRLADYTIPGYWGHNAIWLGTKQQLIDNGLWDTKEIAPFQLQIEHGHSILEMRKSGIKFSNLDQWMDLDHFAHARLSTLKEKSTSEILEIYNSLAEKLNSEYDYLFNADTTARITCSELIYLSYGDFEWPYENILGRPVITPNLMAEFMFHQNSPLQFIAYVGLDEVNRGVFHTKDELADVMKLKKVEPHLFAKEFKRCVMKKANSKGFPKFKNSCIYEYKELKFKQ